MGWINSGLSGGSVSALFRNIFQHNVLTSGDIINEENKEIHK